MPCHGPRPAPDNISFFFLYELLTGSLRMNISPGVLGGWVDHCEFITAMHNGHGIL